MDWLDTGVIVLVTIAIINRIKEFWIPIPKLTWLYTILAFVIGAIVYVISIYAPDIVKNILLIGLAASGIYDVYSKK